MDDHYGGRWVLQMAEQGSGMVMDIGSQPACVCFHVSQSLGR